LIRKFFDDDAGIFFASTFFVIYSLGKYCSLYFYDSLSGFIGAPYSCFTTNYAAGREIRALN